MAACHPLVPSEATSRRLVWHRCRPAGTRHSRSLPSGAVWAQHAAPLHRESTLLKQDRSPFHRARSPPPIQWAATSTSENGHKPKWVYNQWKARRVMVFSVWTDPRNRKTGDVHRDRFPACCLQQDCATVVGHGSCGLAASARGDTADGRWCGVAQTRVVETRCQRSRLELVAVA
jgi:hypothetical protein